MHRPRSPAARLIAAVTLGAGLLGAMPPAAAQEDVGLTPLRGAVAADELPLPRVTQAAQPRSARERRAARARAGRPSATSLPVKGRVSGEIHGEVAKPVAAPRADLAASGAETPRPRRRRRPDEDPFAPPGWRAGGLLLYPSFEAGVGYDSNPNRLGARHEGSLLLRGEGALALRSDWLAHELTASLRGAYSEFPNVQNASRPEAEGRIALRLDARRDTQIDLETRFKVDTDRPGSPDLPAAVTNRPVETSFGGSAGATQRFNRLSIGLRGSVDRASFGNAELNDGLSFDQGDRDYMQYALRLRTGYELTPGVQPFVAATLDSRLHDERIDHAGFARDSNGVTGQVGSSFELTRLLTGEIAAGYERRRYDDPRLGDLRGPVVDAALLWSPTPLTNVRFKAATTLAETTVIGSTGVVARSVSVEVEHALRRDVTLIGAVSLQRNDYRGVAIDERGFTASLKVDYKLSRSLVLRASVTHERLNSTVPGSDYTANVILVGLRLQR